MTKLPKVLTVTGIPYTVEPPEEGTDYGYDDYKQVIYVTEAAAPARQRQYLFTEVALMLMAAAGVSEKTGKRCCRSVGAVLNRFIIDNSLDWVKSGKPAPDTIWINGLPYVVKRNCNTTLRDRSLGGEVLYNDLVIRLSTEMTEEITTYVAIHECTHAIFFESNEERLAQNEPLVEALAWQIYYFIRDNDFTAIKPE